MSETIDATEAAVELANAHGLDLALIAGTGAGGRIVKSDVEAAIHARAVESANQRAGDDPEHVTVEQYLGLEAEGEPNPDPDKPEGGGTQATEGDGDEGKSEDEDSDLADGAPTYHDVEPEPVSWSRVESFLGPPPPEELDDPVPAAIRAATTLQQLLTMKVDRQRYAAALHARAKAILQGKA